MRIGGLFDLIWKIPVLARKVEAPLSRYAVGLLTYSSTFDISAAKKDFDYQPKINQDKGMASLQQWVNKIGGIDKFVGR